MSPHIPGPWHVNGIDSKRGRITGDETSVGWDKLQINANNCTVATVYKAGDARLIAAAPALLEAIERITLAAMSRDNHMGDPLGMLAAKAELEAACLEARAALALATGEGGA